MPRKTGKKDGATGVATQTDIKLRSETTQTCPTPVVARSTQTDQWPELAGAGQGAHGATQPVDPDVEVMILKHSPNCPTT